MYSWVPWWSEKIKRHLSLLCSALDTDSAAFSVDPDSRGVVVLFVLQQGYKYIVHNALVYWEIPFGGTENVTCAVFACNKTSHLPVGDLGHWISPLWISPTSGDNLTKIKSWRFSWYLYKKPFGLNILRRRWREDSLKLNTQNERNIWETWNVSGYVCQKKTMLENQKLYIIFAFCSTAFTSQSDGSQLILCKATKFQMVSFHWAIQMNFVFLKKNQMSHNLWEASLWLFSWHRLWHRIMRSFEDLCKIPEVHFP